MGKNKSKIKENIKIIGKEFDKISKKQLIYITIIVLVLKALFYGAMIMLGIKYL